MRYRTDRVETTEHGQQVGYTDWLGGPSISRVQALCPDGATRWAHITGEADTWFSLPAYVNNGGAGRVTGWVGTDDGVWHFHADTAQEPISWRPIRPPAAKSGPAATAEWHCELTDTFGGEANYSWVRRETLELPAGASRRQIITAAKAALGLTGARCRVEDYGDSFTLRPYGACVVAFIALHA